MIHQIVFFTLFTLFFDVHVVVSSKERDPNVSSQDVQRRKPSQFHQGREPDSQAESIHFPDEGRDPPLDALLSPSDGFLGWGWGEGSLLPLDPR